MTCCQLARTLLAAFTACSCLTLTIARAAEPERPAAPGGDQADKTLVVNGGMEEGQKAPNAWKQGAAVPGVQYTWDRGEGRDSKASLHLHKTASKYFPIAQWYQVLQHDGEASKIRVSVWVKAESATKGVIDVLFANRNGRAGHQWVAYIGAKSGSDPPATHEWKEYSGTVEIPPGTTQLGIALQIYGPGKLWFDDVRAEFVSNVTGKEEADGPSGASAVQVQDVKIEGNGRMRYFLIGPGKNMKAPSDGYKLVVVMPGGDGGEDFQPFVKRIYENALGEEYLVAQPVAVQWSPTQRITWPTRAIKVPRQRFSTEDFVEAVVRDVANRYTIDERHVFTLSWSSGGPAAYAVSLVDGTPITGSFVAMSVFRPDHLPALENAEGHAYYLEHSPEDRVCPFRMAKQAEQVLRSRGAKVHLNTCQGGHGWRGDVYGRIRSGIEWLVEQAAPE